MNETRCTKKALWDTSIEYQAKQKCAFIKEIIEPLADLGETNLQKYLLENKLNKSIKSIDCLDFNIDPIPGKWGTLFCFEILEHILNPLLFLQNMSSSLNLGGILYLSTPSRPHFLWTDKHYHEIDKKRLKWLFAWDGVKLTIEDSKNIRLWRGCKWHLKGVRPLMRINTFTTIYKIRKE